MASASSFFNGYGLQKITTTTSAGGGNIYGVTGQVNTNCFLKLYAVASGGYPVIGASSGNTIPFHKIFCQSFTEIEEQYTEGVQAGSASGYAIWCCAQLYYDDNHLIRWSTAQYNYASISPSNTINGLTLAQYTAQGGLPPTIPQLSPSSPGDPGDPVILNYAANITIRYAS